MEWLVLDDLSSMNDLILYEWRLVERRIPRMWIVSFLEMSPPKNRHMIKETCAWISRVFLSDVASYEMRSSSVSKAARDTK